MLTTQANYHLSSKDNAATVEFVNNMLQNEAAATSYLNNMNTLSQVSKMCSSLGAHWPSGLNVPAAAAAAAHQASLTGAGPVQLSPLAGQSSAAAAAAAAALAAGHNIESILNNSYSVKIDNEKNNSQMHKQLFSNVSGTTSLVQSSNNSNNGNSNTNGTNAANSFINSNCSSSFHGDKQLVQSESQYSSSGNGTISYGHSSLNNHLNSGGNRLNNNLNMLGILSNKQQDINALKKSNELNNSYEAG
jgi:hypothetical protein